MIYAIIPHSEDSIKKLKEILLDTSRECDRHIFILPNHFTSIDEAAHEYALKEEVASVLSKLTPKEERVLRLRYGFDGHERTLEEVGAEVNVTRERIRQIEGKALRKLRHPSKAKKLKEYY